jgi:hypothetical protein
MDVCSGSIIADFSRHVTEYIICPNAIIVQRVEYIS